MKVTLGNKQGRVTIDCNAGERVLHAGLRQGVPLPYECATGLCGMCRARAQPHTIVEQWPEAPGAKSLNSDKGEFLMCQSTPQVDCKILVPGKIDLAVGVSNCPRHALGTLSRFTLVAPDVATFQLQLDTALGFSAGQFVLIRPEGVRGYRSYSMTNFCESTEQLQFVIKRCPGGSFSEWLFAPEFDCSPVEVFGPLGKATFRPDEDKDIVCIAGGSGIAGIMAILAHANRIGYFSDHRAWIFFGVRTVADFFFLDELQDLADSVPENVNICLAVSEELDESSGHHGRGALPVKTGFVHEVARGILEDDNHNRVVFLGGPPAMLDGALRMLLGSSKIPIENIRYDKYS